MFEIRPFSRVAPRAAWSSFVLATLAVVACSDAPVCSMAEAAGREPKPAPRAPAPGSVRLIVVGDVGEGNLAQRLVARAMNAKCASVGGCDAVLMTGDNFYGSGVADTSDSQWRTKFEEPYDLPSLDVPFYVVLGNHDVRSSWQAQLAYGNLEVGDEPGMRPSKRWNMPAAWYDVRLSGVHVFAVDTTHPSDAQTSDMTARVLGSDAAWKITFAHHPRYTSGAHFYDNEAPGEASRHTLQESIFCNTDLFISGHDHDLEFIDKGRNAACPNTYFAISGAGSKVRQSTAPRDPKSLFFDDDTEGFAYVELQENELHFEFVDMCGNVRFEKNVTK
jgi:tartrate-resistant acid phosphatase type 5